MGNQHEGSRRRIEFVELPSSGSEVANFEYIDRETSRYFNVRQLEGPTSIEAVVGVGTEKLSGTRYFLEEFVPTGRLCNEDVSRVADVPRWDRVRKQPAAAWEAIRKAQEEDPDLAPMLSGSGYGDRSIFYDSLDACRKQIENALDADTWVVTSEPIKRVRLGARCEIQMGTYAALRSMPGGEQINAAIAEITAALATHERAEVSGADAGVRIEVKDTRLEYPDNLRLVVSISSAGRPEGYGFVRGTWAELGDRIAGRRLPRYDGPEGIAIGLPAYGQKFGLPERKTGRITSVEALHYQGGSSNKIYAAVTVDGKRWIVWGSFEKGKFQAMAGSPGGDWSILSKKRDKGYERIDESRIPLFEKRVLAAVDRKTKG